MMMMMMMMMMLNRGSLSLAKSNAGYSRPIG